MLRKLGILLMLALGVLGRSVSEKDDTFTDMFPTDYCGEDNAPQVRASLSSFEECVKRIYTDGNNMMIFRQAYLTNNYALIFKTFCASSRRLKACSRPTFSSMSSCVSASVLQSSQEQFDQAIDFLCENEGAKMTLSYTKGAPCMKEKHDELASCKTAKMSAIKRLLNVYGNGPAIPNNEKCSVELSASNCELAAFKSCSDPEIGTLAEELHNRLIGNANCDETITPVTPESRTEAGVSRQGGQAGIVQLNKKMLDLIVRRYEIDTWARENELKIQHTDLTSDIKEV